MKERFESVDIMKGIAIIWVVLTHYSQRFAMDVWSYVWAYLQMGCQMFFVLSSLTLCFSLQRKKQSYGRYMLNRAKRLIIPWWLIILVYYLAGTISALALGSNVIGNNTDPLAILFNLVFLNGLIPFCNNDVVFGGWFIGTLVVFYALHPFIFSLYKKAREKAGNLTKYLFGILSFVVGFAVLMIVTIATDSPHENNSFLYFSFMNQLCCWMLGIVLWDLYDTKKAETLKLPFLKFLFFFALAVAVFYLDFDYAFFIEPSVFGLSFMYFFVFLDRHLSEKQNVVKSFVASLGKMSMAIFLTHILIVWYVTSFILSYAKEYLHSEIGLFLLLSPVILLIVYAVAWIFHIITNWITGLIWRTKREDKRQSGQDSLK